MNNPKVKVYTARELLLKEFPKKQYFLDPLLFRGSLMLLFAPPGIGKTFAALGMAVAAASKGSFLKWKSLNEARVLYVDGELGDEIIAERLAKFVVGIDYAYNEDNLKFISPDDFNRGEIPQISNPADHAFYLQAAKDRDVIFFDNYGCLTGSSGRDTDEQVWERCWKLLKQLRAAGKAVVIIHHAGKGGSQLGTSKKEQPLNWMVELKRPAIYEPTQGARFEFKFTKVRGKHGEAVEDLLVDISEGERGIMWEWRGLSSEMDERIHRMKGVGMTDTQIAEETGRPIFYIKTVLNKKEIDVKEVGSSFYYQEKEEDLF